MIEEQGESFGKPWLRFDNPLKMVCQPVCGLLLIEASDDADLETNLLALLLLTRSTFTYPRAVRFLHPKDPHQMHFFP